MTLWEYAACMDGYRRANQTKEDPAPAMSDERMAELGIEGM
jgi:hypothetical protein